MKVVSKRILICEFCLENGIEREATYIAPQCATKTDPLEYKAICLSHYSSWWDDFSDTIPPVFKLLSDNEAEQDWRTQNAGRVREFTEDEVQFMEDE